MMLVRTLNGVVMATGGFTRDVELMRSHLRGPVLGGLASDGNSGDLVRISGALGLDIANMNEAWYAPMVLDLAPYPVSAAFRLPGDSMLLVNKFGQRAVNEKTTYNEMTRASPDLRRSVLVPPRAKSSSIPESDILFQRLIVSASLSEKSPDNLTPGNKF